MKRLRQILKFGWRHANQISSENPGLSKYKIFWDIIKCFYRYKLWSNQYYNNKFWSLSKSDRDNIGHEFYIKGKVRDEWQKDFQDNRKFLVKFSNVKYELPHLREKRNKAYTKRFNIGKNLFVEHNVIINRQHYLNGSIKIGDNVLLAKNVFIDYSGEVIIGDNVALTNGVIIESHSHPSFLFDTDKTSGAAPSKIEIEQGVIIGSNSIVLESVKKIGRYAKIGAGSVVRSPIPPYAIVVGNPAKIVGFIFTPNQMSNFEKSNFSEDNRTNIEEYTNLYNKYYKYKIKEITQFLKLGINL